MPAWALPVHGDPRAGTQWEELYGKEHDDIATLRIKPGEKISEAKLAARDGAGRAPTRNIIQKLREESFAVVKPQGRYRGSAHFGTESRVILQIRLRPESFAAEMAASYITEEGIALLDTEFSRLRSLRNGTEEKP